MHYTLKQLRYCLAAAQTCSVTRASEIMHVSQPSISAAIAQIESAFNIQIFIRHHAQGLSLTPTGKKFVQESNRFMTQAENLEVYAKTLGNTVVGKFDVGCISTVSAIAMPALVRTFCEKYPDSDINCIDGNQEFLFNGLQEGKFELALTYDLQISSDFTFQPLIELSPYALLPSGHELAEREMVSLAELASHPMVLLNLPLSREYFRSLFLSVGVEPVVSHRANSMEMIRSLVGNGFGYSLSNVSLNRFLAANRASKETVAVDESCCVNIPLSDDLLPLKFGLVMLKGAGRTCFADTFSEYCAKYWSQQTVGPAA